jgi:hypothetical protein
MREPPNDWQRQKGGLGDLHTLHRPGVAQNHCFITGHRASKRALAGMCEWVRLPKFPGHSLPSVSAG